MACSLDINRYYNTVTYSFPDSPADYQSGFGQYDDNGNGIKLSGEPFYGFTPSQQAATRWAIETGGAYSVEGFTNLNFSSLGYGNGDGTLRFANSADAKAAYAFFPSPNQVDSGDVWFGPAVWHDSLVNGGRQHHTVLHELGHALGLKHPHDSGLTSNFKLSLDASFDALEFTVMSYRDFAGDSLQQLYRSKG